MNDLQTHLTNVAAQLVAGDLAHDGPTIFRRYFRPNGEIDADQAICDAAALYVAAWETCESGERPKLLTNSNRGRQVTGGKR